MTKPHYTKRPALYTHLDVGPHERRENPSFPEWPIYLTRTACGLSVRTSSATRNPTCVTCPGCDSTP